MTFSVKDSYLSQRAIDRSSEASVAAMSDVLANFSQEIAAAIRDLIRASIPLLCLNGSSQNKIFLLRKNEEKNRVFPILIIFHVVYGNFSVFHSRLREEKCSTENLGWHWLLVQVLFYTAARGCRKELKLH